MFNTIRQFMELTYDCSMLTHHYTNSTPIDLQESNGDVSVPNYFTDPTICLTGNFSN